MLFYNYLKLRNKYIFKTVNDFQNNEDNECSLTNKHPAVGPTFKHNTYIAKYTYLIFNVITDPNLNRIYFSKLI